MYNHPIFEAEIENLELIKESIVANGYSIINNLFSDEDIKSLLDFIKNKPIKYAQIDPKTRKQIKTLHHFNIHNYGKLFRDIPLNNFIENLNSLLLNDEFYKTPNYVPGNFVVNQYTARSANSALSLHRDDRNPLGNAYYPTWLQWLIPLEDTCIENGCTVIKPKTHKLSDNSKIKLIEEVPLELKTNQVVCWDGRLIHGALKNKTPGTRWALILTFTRWYIKQEFKMIASMDSQILNSLSDREKYLYGATVEERFSPEEGLSSKGDLKYAEKKINQYKLLNDALT
ncbi:hypothetical protein CL656_04995 [bacterium]|nr:hypothetical protein [bacterium]|tara:strand:- start:96 stop:953 length:858 start_codon:yes stop_codon:yes gene_type:complete